MSQTPNVKVPLVYLDRERAGQITREWIPYLQQAANAASTGDTSALSAALEAAILTIGAQGAALAALAVRVTALENDFSGEMVLQPVWPADSTSDMVMQ